MADETWDVIVVGSGNAALCAGLAARERGARTLVLEKADTALAGGNTKYTAGAMRFAYGSGADLMALIRDTSDPRLARADFGSYDAETFAADLAKFNEGRPLTEEQRNLVGRSLETMYWLAGHGIKFEPIWERQSYEKDGKRIFWGGLSLASDGEGVGLFEAERDAFLARGGEMRYGCAMVGLVEEDGRVVGLRTERADAGDRETLRARSVVLASGGFEADAEMRRAELGAAWGQAKVRGTPHNTGDGLHAAFALGAAKHGFYGNCHATPMDARMKDYGNLDLPHGERKNYRKICYFLGVMVNRDGHRFVDEGADFRNYTYAQFGRAVLEQPGGVAWQVFDAKVAPLLYEEYRFHDAHYVAADTLEDLVERMNGVDRAQTLATLRRFDAAVDETVAFDPTVKDGKAARGLSPPRSNWAQRLDTPPFRAYPVTGGITFTYGGLKVSRSGAVLREDGAAIPGLYACGELVGGVFVNGYPGGSGLTSGAIFGRRAGDGAAAYAGT